MRVAAHIINTFTLRMIVVYIENAHKYIKLDLP